ncbi:WD repeat-containing protein 21 [Sphaceloma murrayae]|uniref:WD repeat-containing protein 21 n=1 Tax=Sphaceloma murrayae TaxID=2082308 RepID=A0A2K1QHJ3_9PEZI|nr:WD repeat-containing protein 21 [Sphaceloma murrayae]
MDGRPLPGFYWDEEKRKYFRIQPNHRAPAGAKHSVENVKKEAQASKKRKVELRRRNKVLKETIQRAPALEHFQAQIGLGRELGRQSPRRAEAARSKIFASKIRPRDSLCLHACRDCGSSSVIYDYAPIENGAAMLTGVGDNNSSGVSVNRGVHETRQNTSDVMGGIRSQLTSVNVTGQTMLVTAESCNFDNVFITRVPDGSGRHHLEYPIIQMRVGDLYWTVQESVVQPGPNGDRAMLLRNSPEFRGVTDLLDIEQGRVVSNFSCVREMRSADWLDQNTGMVGSMLGHIMLVDMRTADRTVRFKGPHGILSIRGQGDGNGIWVEDEHRISLYDVRFPLTRMRCHWSEDSWPAEYHQQMSRKKTPKAKDTLTMVWEQSTEPVISIPARNDLGQAAMAVWHGTGLLATRTIKNSIAMYSTADGSFVMDTAKFNIEPMRCRSANEYWLKKIKCGYDERGVPVLYYAIGTQIQSFRYGLDMHVDDIEAWDQKERRQAVKDSRQWPGYINVRVKEIPVKIKAEPESATTSG